MITPVSKAPGMMNRKLGPVGEGDQPMPVNNEWTGSMAAINGQ